MYNYCNKYKTMRTAFLSVCIMLLASTASWSQSNLPDKILSDTIGGRLYASQDTTEKAKDDTCLCRPSIPIEIAAVQLLWGLPAYWIPRVVADKLLISPSAMFASYTLLMFTVGVSAELTSGCEANYLHAWWIGCLTHMFSMLISSSLGDYKPFEPRYKFHFGQYIGYSIVPSVATVLLFNLFLEPPEKKNADQGLLDGMWLPYYNGNSYGLGYSVKF